MSRSSIRHQQQQSTIAEGENDSTHTEGLLTCNILPGVQAREYIIKSSSPPLGLFDLLAWISILFLIKIVEYKYACGVFVAWLFIKRKSVRKESILVIRDVGIQIKTIYWGGSTVSRFINRLKIEDVIINEGISFWQIKSYIAILVKDEDKMVVVFENLLPKLRPNLLKVYHGIRETIFTQRPIIEEGIYI